MAFDYYKKGKFYSVLNYGRGCNLGKKMFKYGTAQINRSMLPSLIALYNAVLLLVGPKVYRLFISGTSKKLLFLFNRRPSNEFISVRSYSTHEQIRHF